MDIQTKVFCVCMVVSALLGLGFIVLVQGVVVRCKDCGRRTRGMYACRCRK
jgi:hypothetical protein